MYGLSLRRVYTLSNQYIFIITSYFLSQYPSFQETRKKKKKKRTHTSDAVVRSFIYRIKLN